MLDGESDVPGGRGPFGLYERWPVVHVVIGIAVIITAAVNREWVLANPRWLWFLFLALPVLAAHEWEEFGFPGGFRRWFNADVCRSDDPESPLTPAQAALAHMPLMLLYPALALAGSRWPWVGLGGLYGLVADGMFHVSATGITRRRSPGLATALLLYIPLGAAATWHLVSIGDVGAGGLIAAALSGTIVLNLFLFLPAWRVTGAQHTAAPASAPRPSGRTGGVPEAPAWSATADEILPLTRRLSAAIIPVLALAFIVLYLLPDTNGDHFAFFVTPRMSAMMLGATYFTGVIYFSTVLWARAWHQVRLGLLPVALFATVLGVTTLLNWSDFNHRMPQFWLWCVLYFGLPPVLPVVWLRNERHARPLPAVPGDVRLGRVTRTILVVIGVGLGVTSGLLFFSPRLVATVWPWALSDLSARVTAAELGLFSLFGIHLAVDAHWSRVRDLMRPQLFSPWLFLIAIAASWGDFDRSNPLTQLYVAFVVVVFVLGFPALYFPGEMKRRREAAAATTTGAATTT